MVYLHSNENHYIFNPCLSVINESIKFVSIKTNTFQCVIAFDGSRTYVMFLYADGGINWTAGDNHGDGNGFGGIDGLSALVGFDAGDGKRYLFLNDSYTDNIVNIDEKSNVGMPGLFVFRVDQTEIIGKVQSSLTY